MPKLMYEPYPVLILLEAPELHYFFKGCFYQSLIPLSKSCHKHCPTPCPFRSYFSQQESLCKAFIEKEFKATCKATADVITFKLVHWMCEESYLDGPITIILVSPTSCLCPIDTSTTWTSPRHGFSVQNWVLPVTEYILYHYMMLLKCKKLKLHGKGMSSSHATVPCRSFQSQRQNSLSTSISLIFFPKSSAEAAIPMSDSWYDDG